jgi:hypothetical protein
MHMIKSLLICLALGCAVAGCSSGGGNQPPLDASQEKQATDLSALRQKANGNFDSLSDADKKTAISIAGSEQGARMLLANHGPGARPGGPPGGRPPAGN